MAVEWQELDAAAFDALPEPTKPPKGDAAWEEIVTALESGKAVRLPYADEKEMRGKRLSLGRRSIRRGFKVDLRYGDGYIAARRRAEGAADGAGPGEPFRAVVQPDEQAADEHIAEHPEPPKRRTRRRGA